MDQFFGRLFNVYLWLNFNWVNCSTLKLINTWKELHWWLVGFPRLVPCSHATQSHCSHHSHSSRLTESQGHSQNTLEKIPHTQIQAVWLFFRVTNFQSEKNKGKWEMLSFSKMIQARDWNLFGSWLLSWNEPFSSALFRPLTLYRTKCLNQNCYVSACSWRMRQISTRGWASVPHCENSKTENVSRKKSVSKIQNLRARTCLFLFVGAEVLCWQASCKSHGRILMPMILFWPLICPGFPQWWRYVQGLCWKGGWREAIQLKLR